ncbi:LysM peptidoglycan-binding domain-containing protein, partial [bacterium]
MTRRLYMGSSLVLLALLTVTSTLHATVTSHTVQKGESLTSIAAKFYGDREHFREIALYNDITDPRLIRPGQRIKLPYSRMVTLGRGESLSMVAKKEWGNAKLYPILAAANGLRSPEAVSAGTRLVVPVMVPYKLKRGESLSEVAEDFYGNPKAYTSIALASGISNPGRVAPGTKLRVPLVLKRSTSGSSKKAAVSSAAAPRTKKAKSRSKEERPVSLNKNLARAGKAYRGGDYGKARDLVNQALPDLRGTERAEALRL